MGTNELKNPLKTIKIEFIYRILIQTLKMEKGLKKFSILFLLKQSFTSLLQVPFASCRA